jgi:hypothetical protein
MLVSKVASYYEKLRTSMDYGTEETILRRSIERILKRILFLNTDSSSIAQNIVRELVWGGYFENLSVSETKVSKIASSIHLYLKLKDEVVSGKLLPNEDISEFFMQILSCVIEKVLIPNGEKDAMANFMFQVLRESVDIVNESQQTRDAQVFIAVNKNFSRNDVAFLRYKLFIQIFGELTEANFRNTSRNFAKGYNEIKYQLNYIRKDKIFNHIKKKNHT